MGEQFQRRRRAGSAEEINWDEILRDTDLQHWARDERRMLRDAVTDLRERLAAKARSERNFKRNVAIATAVVTALVGLASFVGSLLGHLPAAAAH